MNRLVQGSPEWLAARVGKVTSSVAAACLRLHPHMSAQQAYRLILGLETIPVNDYMQRGMDYESTARDAYEAQTGQLVEEVGLIVHPDHPWLAASPDGLCWPDGALEIKCMGKLPAKIPVYHKIQCLVVLACTGRKWCDYWAWNMNGHYTERVYSQGIAGLINRLKTFHELYVLPRVEPGRKKAKRRKRQAEPIPANCGDAWEDPRDQRDYEAEQ